jgi:hypothetical protein
LRQEQDREEGEKKNFKQSHKEKESKVNDKKTFYFSNSNFRGPSKRSPYSAGIAGKMRVQ